MKKGKKILAAFLSVLMLFNVCGYAQAEETEKAGKAEKVDDTWYYHSQNEGEYVFEKVSHPDRGADEVDGFLDEADSRSQSYAWSAIECGDYIYVGTCYNSTYGIYWRNVNAMMQKLGKTPAEAAQIARDFVQFVFNDKFDETLRPRGIIVRFHKETGAFEPVYDSKNDSDAVMQATNCSGYRMAFEFHDKLYFVSLAQPTMFLLEVDPSDPENPKCEVVFKRSLSATGQQAQIAAGVHGLIVYDDEILMCLADEATDGSKYLDGQPHPEGGVIVASRDGKNWRVIADENDLGPSGYHTYDGLMGGGIWDIIEFNGHLYVTVVTDLTDLATGIVNKQGFAMYRGTKGGDGEFTWEMVVGDTAKEGVNYPYGLGTKYMMACNLWVYDNHLYMGSYNDPMLDLTEVAARANFEPLYYDLHYSISLYRMDQDEKIELIGGTPNEVFPEKVGNMGPGLGGNGNQYVWRMLNHNDQLWIATYDTSTLTSAFTQLTDSQLVGMSKEEYMQRLKQIEKMLNSFAALEGKYDDIFDKVFGSDMIRNLFDSIQRFVDTNVGNENPVPAFEKFMESYHAFKDRFVFAQKQRGFVDDIKNFYEVMKELNGQFIQGMDRIVEEVKGPVFYFGTNYYMKQSVPGFDLLVTKDGVNFEVVTNDGFGDPSNHGVRTLTSADDGKNLFVGTANPFYGGQMWKLVTEASKQETDKSELADLVEKVKEMDLNLYTEESAAAVKDALERAEEVLVREDATQEEVTAAKDALEEAVNNLELKEQEKEGYTIWVDGAVYKENCKYNDAVTVEAGEVEGKEFAGWKVNGQIVSLKPVYKFYVAGNTEIETVYKEVEAPAVEEKAAAMLSNVIVTKNNDGKSDIRFVGQLVVPEGYKLKSAGLVWSAADGTTLELGNNAVKTTYISTISNTNQFSTTIKGVPGGRFVRGVIFATMINTETNEIVVYAEEAKVVAE